MHKENRKKQKLNTAINSYGKKRYSLYGTALFRDRFYPCLVSTTSLPQFHSIAYSRARDRETCGHQNCTHTQGVWSWTRRARSAGWPISASPAGLRAAPTLIRLPRGCASRPARVCTTLVRACGSVRGAARLACSSSVAASTAKDCDGVRAWAGWHCNASATRSVHRARCAREVGAVSTAGRYAVARRCRRGARDARRWRWNGHSTVAAIAQGRHGGNDFFFSLIKQEEKQSFYNHTTSKVFPGEKKREGTEV